MGLATSGTITLDQIASEHDPSYPSRPDSVDEFRYAIGYGDDSPQIGNGVPGFDNFYGSCRRYMTYQNGLTDTTNPKVIVRTTGTQASMRFRISGSFVGGDNSAWRMRMEYQRGSTTASIIESTLGNTTLSTTWLQAGQCDIRNAFPFPQVPFSLSTLRANWTTISSSGVQTFFEQNNGTWTYSASSGVSQAVAQNETLGKTFTIANSGQGAGTRLIGLKLFVNDVTMIGQANIQLEIGQ